jgi:hypothetical protein
MALNAMLTNVDAPKLAEPLPLPVPDPSPEFRWHHSRGHTRRGPATSLAMTWSSPSALPSSGYHEFIEGDCLPEGTELWAVTQRRFAGS